MMLSTIHNASEHVRAKLLLGIPHDELIPLLYILCGKARKRIVDTDTLIAWALEIHPTPAWLFSECVAGTGNALEAATLIVQQIHSGSIYPLDLLASPDTIDERKRWVLDMWSRMNAEDRWLFNCLITGKLRSVLTYVQAAEILHDECTASINTIAYRIAKTTMYEQFSYDKLTSADTDFDHRTIAYQLDQPYLSSVSSISFNRAETYIAHSMPDGIHQQIVHRNGSIFFADIHGLFVRDVVLPKNVHYPIDFVLHVVVDPHKTLHLIDCMEYDGKDVRSDTLPIRLAIAQSIIEACALQISIPAHHPITSPEVLHHYYHDQCEQRRNNVVIRNTAGVQSPLNLPDIHLLTPPAVRFFGVLLYAQGTTFTIGVRSSTDDNYYVPLAKCIIEIDAEHGEFLHAYVKHNATEKYGPVRSVAPSLVIEFSYEQALVSKRHKSGYQLVGAYLIAVRHDLGVTDVSHIRILNSEF